MNTPELLSKIETREARLAIIGLGYVGLPLAVEFGKRYAVVGFDVNSRRLDELRAGHDRTLETTAAELGQAVRLSYSNRIEDLREVDVFIVTVPTPIDRHKRPDLTPLVKASETVGRALKPGAVVVYESTVYPGCTEEDCVPILEKFSGLKFNRDFFCGYSPERINPGDKVHTVTKIKKVTAGSTPEIGQAVDALYRSIIVAGTHLAPSIKVAEAAKVIENSQRDINIAFVNELSLIFERMGIDTQDVLEAAGTKWNFLPFRPGLVGGHCIGVDPYYLTHKAEMLGYHPEVILAGRRINDGMGKFVAEQTVKHLVRNGWQVKDAPIIVLGLTFKEDCPDLRNSKVIDVIRELQSYGARVIVHEPVADADEARHEYGVELTAWDDLPPAAAIVAAVAHKEFKARPLADFVGKLQPGGVVADVKSLFDAGQMAAQGVTVWRL